MQSISDEERAAEVKQIEHRLRTLREAPDEAVKALVKLSHEPGMWMLVRLSPTRPPITPATPLIKSHPSTSCGLSKRARDRYYGK